MDTIHKPHGNKVDATHKHVTRKYVGISFDGYVLTMDSLVQKSDPDWTTARYLQPEIVKS